MQGVYAITHVESGRSYVGSSIAISKRWYSHRYELKHGKHKNSHLQNAWAKYGASAFVFHVLEEVADIAQLIATEQQYLDAMQPLVFNSGIVAFPPMLGLKRPHSESTKKKIGDRHRGHPKSPEHCAAMSAARTGVKQSPECVANRVAKITGKKHPPRSAEWKRKQRETRTGTNMPLETRKKISDSHKKIKHSKEWNEKVSRTLMGHSVSKETRDKIGARHVGKHPWNIGLRQSPTHYAALEESRAKRRGVPLTQEHRDKLKAAWARRKRIAA